MIVLGIDPGTRVAGIGVVQKKGNRIRRLHSEAVRMPGKALELPERLQIFHAAIQRVLTEFPADVAAVEAVFQHKFARSALILGHSRGVALLACAQAGVPVVEYPPSRVKSAITGQGNADKQQVKRMVELILGTRIDGPDDETDALALALCHAQASTLMSLAAGARR